MQFLRGGERSSVGRILHLALLMEHVAGVDCESCECKQYQRRYREQDQGETAFLPG